MLQSLFRSVHTICLLLKHFLRLMNLHREFFLFISCYVRILLFWIEFSTHSSIDFLPGKVSLQHDMKWTQKTLWSNLRSTCLKNVSTADTSSALFQAVIVTTSEKKLVRHQLDVATITTYLSSFAPLRWLFKTWEVFFYFMQYNGNI